MKKSKFSPQQIKILKEFDNGKELKRLKELEEENRKLKQMYASLALDHQMAKEIIENKL